MVGSRRFRRWELGVGSWELTLRGSRRAAVPAACGKKGPPLAPFVRVPAAAEVEAPRRVGDDVYVTVTVPATNIDGSKPASIARVEVYGVTTATSPPPGARFSRSPRSSRRSRSRRAPSRRRAARSVPGSDDRGAAGNAVTIATR